MQVLTHEEIAARPRLERICLYGKNKSGKSRLVGSLPRPGGKWGKVAVIAADPNSELLSTTINKKDTIVIKPGPPVGHSGPFDPLDDYSKIASYDFKSIDPEINTVVFDTMSQAIYDLLYAYAENNTVQKNHVSVGIKGTKSYHAQPDKSDFGAAQRSHNHLVKLLFEQPIHVICVYHEDWAEPKSGSLDELLGGPATVGTATIKEVPKMYDTVLRMTSAAGRFAVQTERLGAWPAEIRHARVGARLGQNGVYPLRDDPSHFWPDYDAFVGDGMLPITDTSVTARPGVTPPVISWT